MRFVTEEEALKLWCSYSRIANGSSPSAVSVNRYRGDGLPDYCMCLGSKCMHWDWDVYKYMTKGRCIRK